MKLGMIIVPLLSVVAGCGASYPAPTQHMADAQAALRSAQELGADGLPEAQLHLKLAEEQIAKGKADLEDNDNKRADFTFVRAKADAELALALAKEQKAKVQTQRAAEKAGAQKAADPVAPQGVQP